MVLLIVASNQIFQQSTNDPFVCMKSVTFVSGLSTSAFLRMCSISGSLFLLQFRIWAVRKWLESIY